MQNKPNLRNDQITINPYPTKDYENLPLHGRGKNKPNQTQFKANSDLSAPIKAKTNPISSPIKPNPLDLLPLSVRILAHFLTLSPLSFCELSTTDKATPQNIC
jgi:hypothetical protein